MLNYNNINFTTNNTKHDYNTGWDMGSPKEGAAREWEAFLAEDAGVPGRGL